MSDNILINNAIIVTCDQSHRVIEDGAMLVSDTKIIWLGPQCDLDAALIKYPAPNRITIDATGKILMPGLINMHAHCGDTLFRGLVEDLPLETWLETVWKAEAAILPDRENCRLGVEIGFAELLMGGTTTVMDMFWHPDITIETAINTGIRVAVGGIFFDFDGMDGGGPQNREADAVSLFQQFGEHENVMIGTLPHGTYTVGPQNIKIALQISRDQNGFFCTHAAETVAEQQTIKENYNTTVIRHLHELDALGPKTVLAHCVHVDDQEIDLLASTQTHVVHNPLSNLKLASGFAPIPKMIEKNINITLGTDGAISGNDMDMWLAMRLAATIHKAANNNPAAVSAQQALHMATLNGAKALNAEEKLGSLEIGKSADFILIETKAPHAMPMFNPINHLVFSASKNDVCDVFVSGRQLMQNRKLTTMNLTDIHQKISSLQPTIAATLEC